MSGSQETNHNDSNNARSSTTTQDAAHHPAVAAWRAAVERELKGKSSVEQALVTRLLDGVELPALRHETQDPGAGGGDASGLPGFVPYTRGGAALPQRRWDVRQQLASPTPAELAGELAEEWQHGASSIHLTLDAAVRAGLEPLAAEGRSLAGAGGTALYSTAMLAEALPEPAAATALRLDGGAAFLPVAAMHAALLLQLGPSGKDSQPGEADLFLADPLGALARDGRLPLTLTSAYDQLAALARWCHAKWPGVRCIRVSTLPYHDAGATETQDVAAALATGVAYLRGLTERGIPLAQAAEQIGFEVRANADLYLTLAKLRALRTLWTQALHASGLDEPPPIKLYAATSWRTMTQRDPWVNLLRATSAAFAAACAGVDGLRVVPFDAALGEPDRFGRRLARTTQFVLLEEAHLGKVADPAGGADAFEGLSDDVARHAWGAFQEIERRGGMAAVLLDGSWHSDVDEMHTARLKEVATRSQPIVGVSEYPLVAETPAETYKLPDAQAVADELEQAWEAAQAKRDDTAIQTALAKLPRDDDASAWASEDPHAFEALVEAAAAGASVAEMAERLGFAAHHGLAPVRLTQAFSPRRLAQPYEALRDAADEYAEAHHGTRPRVFLVNLGPPAEHNARAAFADSVAQAGGLEVLISDGIVAETGAGTETCVDAATGVQQFRESGASLAILCGADERYRELVPQLAPQLKQAGCTWLVLAGHAGEHAEAWQSAGLDQTIYRGSDILAILRQWHAKLGL